MTLLMRILIAIGCTWIIYGGMSFFMFLWMNDWKIKRKQYHFIPKTILIPLRYLVLIILYPLTHDYLVIIGFININDTINRVIRRRIVKLTNEKHRIDHEMGRLKQLLDDDELSRTEGILLADGRDIIEY